MSKPKKWVFEKFALVDPETGQFEEMMVGGGPYLYETIEQAGVHNHVCRVRVTIEPIEQEAGGDISS